MKNIKKIYPLIVGLVLLISVAAYGTRAYFSDSTKEDANIKLTLGNVDINGASKEWQYTPDVENKQLTVKGANSDGTPIDKKAPIKDEMLAKEVTIENARPGDSFKKKFTFTNVGSLDQTVKFSTENKSKGLFMIEWENNNFDENNAITLEPTDEVSVTMVVTIKKNVDPEWLKENKQHTDISEFVGSTIDVTAAQTNAAVVE